MLTDCTALDKEIEQVNEEIEVVAGLVKTYIQENASKTVEQDAFNVKYNGLVKRYEKAPSRLDKLKAVQSQRQERAQRLRIFIKSLTEQPLVLEAWGEQLWTMLVERGVVHTDGNIAFEFKNGEKIVVKAE